MGDSGGGKGGSSSAQPSASGFSPDFNQWLSQYQSQAGQAQQSSSQAQQQGSGDGGPSSQKASSSGYQPYTNWSAVGQEVGKGILYGSPGGTVGQAVGGTVMGVREMSTQWGEQNAEPVAGVPNISATRAKKTSDNTYGSVLSGGDDDEDQRL